MEQCIERHTFFGVSLEAADYQGQKYESGGIF
jgi:hypothetical protein